MAKIFVTGIAGFMGSHLADALLNAGHDVVGIDNMLGGYMDNVPAAVKFYQEDACNFEAIKPLLHGVEIVYHLAASPHEGLSVFSPNMVAQNTYNSTLAVASAAILAGVKRFVFTSSMARYGFQKKLPFTEDMIPNPRDPYGVAKLAAEVSLARLGEAHGMEYTVAVPHNVIGSRQKYDDAYRNVASIMINLILQGKKPIIYGDGEQKRAFSFVADVVSPMLELGFKPGIAGEIVNVGPDEEFVSINDLCRRITKLMGEPFDPIYVPDRPMEVKQACCSADKARKLLGYKTTYTLDEGLEEMIQWIAKRGAKPFSYHLPIEIDTDRVPVTWRERLF